MRITIIGTKGSLAGKKLVFEDRFITVGRGRRCDIPIEDDTSVSAEHCKIQVRTDTPILGDAHSLNGTLVDGKRVSEPTKLRNGALVQLGSRGPEFRVRYGSPVTTEALRPRDSGPTRAGPPTPGTRALSAPRIGIGLNTLYARISESELRVRRDSRRKVACVTLFALIGLVMLGVVMERAGSGAKSTATELSAHLGDLRSEVAKFHSAADGLRAGATTTSRRLAALGSKVDDGTESLSALSERLVHQGKQNEERARELSERVTRGAEAVTRLESTLETAMKKSKRAIARAAAPFGAVSASARDAVYAVFIRTVKKGDARPSLQFIGTAFAVNAELGLLGTNAHISGLEIVDVAIRSAHADVLVRCSNRPAHTYRVVRTFTHPDYDRGRGADVGLLQVDLDVDGQRRPLPSVLRPARASSIAQIGPGTPVALLGFPGAYRRLYEREQGSTLVAKLATGVVSATTTSSGAPIDSRSFQRLEHTCATMPGSSGSPVINAAGEIVAIHHAGPSITLGRATEGGGIVKVPTGAVRFARTVRELEHLVLLHFGADAWTPDRHLHN